MVRFRIATSKAARYEVSLAEQTVRTIREAFLRGLTGGCRRRMGGRTNRYGQGCAVRSMRTRPLLARTTWIAFWPGLQTTKVPICNAPLSSRAYPKVV